MIGQRLIEGPLEVGGAHTVGEVAIGAVTEEKFSLVGHSGFDVFSTIDVFLAAVHNTNVACRESTTLKPM